MSVISQMVDKFKDCPTWEAFIEEWKKHYRVSFGGPMAKAVWDHIQSQRGSQQ